MRVHLSAMKRWNACEPKSSSRWITFPTPHIHLLLRSTPLTFATPLTFPTPHIHLQCQHHYDVNSHDAADRVQLVTLHEHRVLVMLLLSGARMMTDACNIYCRSCGCLDVLYVYARHVQGAWVS